MTFLCDKMVPKKIPFKRKNIKKNIKLQRMHIGFPFHHGSSTGIKGFLNCAVITRPWKNACTSLFYSSLHVESGREKN